MAQIISTMAIRHRLEQLGWPFQVPDVVQFLTAQSIRAPEFIAYLDAALETHDGVDDAAISGCTPASGAKITAALKQRGLMVS